MTGGDALPTSDSSKKRSSGTLNAPCKPINAVLMPIAVKSRVPTLQSTQPRPCQPGTGCMDVYEDYLSADATRHAHSAQLVQIGTASTAWHPGLAPLFSWKTLQNQPFHSWHAPNQG